MKFDILEKFNTFVKAKTEEGFDWVTALPVYQHIYNTTHHKSLGNRCISLPST